MGRITDYPLVIPDGAESVPAWSPTLSNDVRIATSSLIGVPGDFLSLGYTSGLGLGFNANTWTDVPWNTLVERVGVFAAHATTTAVTIPVTGRYQIGFTADVIPDNGTREIQYRLVLAGNPANALGFCMTTSTHANLWCAGHPVILAAGSQVKCQVLVQSVNGALGIAGTPLKNYLSVYRVK